MNLKIAEKFFFSYSSFLLSLSYFVANLFKCFFFSRKSSIAFYKQAAVIKQNSMFSITFSHAFQMRSFLNENNLFIFFKKNCLFKFRSYACHPYNSAPKFDFVSIFFSSDFDFILFFFFYVIQRRKKKIIFFKNRKEKKSYSRALHVQWERCGNSNKCCWALSKQKEKKKRQQKTKFLSKVRNDDAVEFSQFRFIFFLHVSKLLRIKRCRRSEA